MPYLSTDGSLSQFFPRVPCRDSVPPSLHIGTSSNQITLVDLEQLRHQRHVKNVYQREIGAAHVILLSKDTVEYVKLFGKSFFCILKSYLVNGLAKHASKSSVMLSMELLVYTTYGRIFFWVNISCANRSKLFCSTEAHCSKRAHAFSSWKEGTRGVPWLANFMAKKREMARDSVKSLVP